MDELFKQADRIEVKFGQAALTGSAREMMGLKKNEDAVGSTQNLAPRLSDGEMDSTTAPSLSIFSL
ncbi:hypothetical protein Saga11_05400 [Bacillus safensis]|nr:hypothetical protein Saga11_05400 [Bacillus safensis]